MIMSNLTHDSVVEATENNNSNITVAYKHSDEQHSSVVSQHTKENVSYHTLIDLRLSFQVLTYMLYYLAYKEILSQIFSP